MLLPGRCRDLRAWGLALWLVAVLGLHAWLAAHWWQRESDLGTPVRLQVALVQPLALHPPPTATYRLPAGAVKAGRVRTDALAPPEPYADAMLTPAPTRLPEIEVELPAPLQAATDDGEPGPEWPPSTRLRYRVVGEFRGPVHGDADVEWLRQGDRYQVRLRIQIGPTLAPFVRRELVSEGRVGPQGIVPERYDEITRLLLGRPRHQGLRLGTGWLQFGHGLHQPAPAGTQDSASQFVQLAWLLLSGRRPLLAGSEIEFPLALPRQLLTWRYALVGQERLATVLGDLETWHLRSAQPAPPGALAAEVWLAPTARYLPVQLHIAQSGGEGAWVRLLLAEPPLQEAENAASQPAPDSL
ncbi:MAG: DUF3108 domain-containing protein [Inhella sp.]